MIASRRYPLWGRLAYGAGLIAATYAAFMLPGLFYAHCASEAQWRMYLSQLLSFQAFVATFPFAFVVFVTLLLLISNIGHYIHPCRSSMFWATLIAVTVPLATFACVAPLVRHSCL